MLILPPKKKLKIGSKEPQNRQKLSFERGLLTANLVGGFLMGIFMGITRNHTFIPEATRLAIATGFLGGLTTFSTFSAETVTLMTHQQYFWTAAIMIAHVAGSIFATLLGIYAVKLLTS